MFDRAARDYFSVCVCVCVRACEMLVLSTVAKILGLGSSPGQQQFNANYAVTIASPVRCLARQDAVKAERLGGDKSSSKLML